MYDSWHYYNTNIIMTLTPVSVHDSQLLL